ncbi:MULTISPECIES: XdhC/CoxI family protein [unclassified Mycolicibacterium]|uniref:XdhC family protein n=2 Tax=Mycolicibacterium TaxID=1866885 RepID=UPI00139149F6|nr:MULTISPECIES: XdhC/CoxI family protein [unclassified Mycolicibacterium]
MNKDVLQWIYAKNRQGQDVLAVAVLETFDRSPYPIGSLMAFDRVGCFHGSVSSGCVEAELYERAMAVFSGHPDTLLGINCQKIEFMADEPDGDPFAPQGPCRGTLTVALHPMTARSFPDLPTFMATVQEGLPAVTYLNLRTGHTSLTPVDDAAVFSTHYDPPPRMVIFGTSDIATRLAALAQHANYAVTVCDPRSAFLQKDRFPAAVELVADWPDRYLRHERDRGRLGADTAIVDLTHDDRFSIPLLLEALDSRRWSPGAHPIFVGALGSRSRSTRKRDTLSGHGLLPADVDRLQAPIGLDLGGRDAPHIALSVLAQVVAAHEGGSGMPRSQSVD